jgi:class 3 adenylate cyclase/tetratricopeptide (TPR) repeat protein
VDITEYSGPEDGRVLPALAERAAELLRDARLALRTGRVQELRALANAVLALDPANTEAEELLVGSAQRRQMTLMFCDIVGSTALADGRDPEETSDILRGYRTTCAKVIERYGGFIDDHQGDGMLVRFGYPEIHEDDARRAVLSGLGIVRAVRERTQRFGAEHAADLHVRIAVHTDLVVLDGVGVAGPTTNEAARIQAVAQPDTVVISDTTHALVKDWFEVRPMGRTSLRGVSRAVEVFTVLGERSAGCLEPDAGRSPFAGRRRQVARMEAVWQAACRDWEVARLGEERPHVPVLFITGASGVGKTRLVSEAARAIGAQCAHCRCSSYHETTSLHAFRSLLETVCGIAERDAPAQRLAKLRARLAQDGPATDLPFLAVALQIPPQLLKPPGVDPRMLREMALQTAAELVQSHQADGPSMLFVDDLHWADQSTLDLVSVLLATRRPGLMLVLAARTGFQPPWPDPLLDRLPLDPLDGGELEQMMRLMPEGSELSDDRRNQLISRSDGIPLFLEELVRTADAFERGEELHRSIRYADYHIPAALRDPLLARLASPGISLDLVQTAATIGREVDLRLLQRVTGCTDDELAFKLAALSAAGLVDVGDTAIHFRHELIREVAYETQRRSVRRRRHSLIADQLARDDVAPVRADAGGAAYHLEMAHRYEEAIEAHLRTARSDQSIGAHTEATRRLTGALGLLEHLPAGPARQHAEIAIRETRSFSAVMAGGYAAPEAAEDHPRCVRLCEELGLAPELLPHLIRSWSYHAFRGDLDEADRVCETMQRVAPDGGAPVPVHEMGAGVVDFFRGQFDEARQLMEACARHPWPRAEGRPPAGWPLPNDLLTAVRAHLVPTLWIMGDRQAAFDMAASALDRANSLDFPYGPFSVGYVKSLLALTRRLDGDHDAAATLAGELIELSERHGFVLWGLAGTIQYHISEVRAGSTAALDRLVESIRVWREALAAEVWTPYWLTELAEAQRMTGRTADALRSLDDAVAVATGTGTTFYLAETLRLRGVVRGERGDSGGRRDLRDALDLARRQQAPALAARAARSFAQAAE